MNNFINIKTVEDLKTILLRQKLITHQAAEEITKLVQDYPLPVEGEDPKVIESKISVITKAESKLLEKYAKYPTLTEFNLMPNTADLAIKWGATFGVALIIGELILKQVKLIQETFGDVINTLYTIYLNELGNPKHKYISDAILESLKIELKSKDGTSLAENEQKRFKETLVIQLVSAFTVVSKDYGIVNDDYQLTVTGRRVMLHLIDIQKFIDVMTEAHQRFHDEIAKIKPSSVN